MADNRGLFRFSLGWCAGEWTGLEAGDGAAIQGERKLVIRAETGAELLAFDLA